MEELIGWDIYFFLHDRMSVKIMTDGEAPCSVTRAHIALLDVGAGRDTRWISRKRPECEMCCLTPPLRPHDITRVIK
jgi:hypothetical protein